jgi:hypothetical protein
MVVGCCPLTAPIKREENRNFLNTMFTSSKARFPKREPGFFYALIFLYDRMECVEKNLEREEITCRVLSPDSTQIKAIN